MKLRHVPIFLRQVLRCLRAEQWCVMSFCDTHGGRSVLTYYRANARYGSFVTAANLIAEDMHDANMQMSVLDEARYILDGGGGENGQGCEDVA